MLPFSKRTTTQVSMEGMTYFYSNMWKTKRTCSKGMLCTSQGLALHFLKGMLPPL